MIEDNNVLNQYTESRRIIRQAMDEHQLVLFVGAGASIVIEAAGILLIIISASLLSMKSLRTLETA